MTPLAALIMVIPLVFWLTRAGRRRLAIGPLAGALAIGVWLAAAAPDNEMSPFSSFASSLLSNAAGLALAGATTAFILASVRREYLDTVLLLIVGGLPVVQAVAGRLTSELLDPELGEQKTDLLVALLVIVALGCEALSAWWWLRPGAPDEERDVTDRAPGAMIGP